MGNWLHLGWGHLLTQESFIKKSFDNTLLIRPLREDLEQIEVHLSLGDLDAEGVVVAIAGDVGLLLWHCLLGVCGAMGI